MPSCDEGRAPNRKTRNGRKKASVVLICMSGSLSTEEVAGRYGAWWAIQVTHSTALCEPHRQRPCVRKSVLCCDRCTLQGPLGSYRTGFTYSEPITLIAFMRKKKYAKLPEFSETVILCALFSFVPKQTLVIFRSCLFHSQRKQLDYLDFYHHHHILVFPLIWLPLLIINIPIFDVLSPVLSSLYLHFLSPCTFLSVCSLVYSPWECQEQIPPCISHSQIFNSSFSERISLSIEHHNIKEGD